MPLDNLPERAPQPPIIESAGGTTDPDNANSGPGAYVLFAIYVALVVLLFVGLTSCVGALGAVVSSTIDEDFPSAQSDTLLPDVDELPEGLDGSLEPLSRT